MSKDTECVFQASRGCTDEWSIGSGKPGDTPQHVLQLAPGDFEQCVCQTAGGGGGEERQSGSRQEKKDEEG